MLWNVANTTNSQIKLYDSSGTAASKGTSAPEDFDAPCQISLPDKRGRVAIGVDSMGNGSTDVVTNDNADVLGGYDGEENHTITINELASHTHTITAYKIIIVGPLAGFGLKVGIEPPPLHLVLQVAMKPITTCSHGGIM